MRSLAAVVFTLCTFALSSVHAQPAAQGVVPAPAGGARVEVPATAAPASATPGSAAQPPAAQAADAPPAATVPDAEATSRAALTLENRIITTAPAATATTAVTTTTSENAAAASELESRRVQHADAWVGFEEQRDQSTRKAERVFFPLALGLQAGLGAAYAAMAEDESKTSRIIAGTTAGLSLAAMLPTIMSKTRNGRRAWFSAGGAAFAFGAGATFATAAEKDSNDRAGRWVGASVALQGLAFLPIALIPGFPDEEDYQAYMRLPAEQRPEAAARILARIDRFEQRVTAISIVGALGAAAVMAVGAMTINDREEAQTLAGLSLIPLGTALLVFAPRLFVRSRTDRYGVGDKPTKLPFNGW